LTTCGKKCKQEEEKKIFKGGVMGTRGGEAGNRWSQTSLGGSIAGDQ
jgi:hypothetical protein